MDARTAKPVKQLACIEMYTEYIYRERHILSLPSELLLSNLLTHCCHSEMKKNMSKDITHGKTSCDIIAKVVQQITMKIRKQYETA